MSNNDKPAPARFLDLREEEIQEWRALPQTALLLRDLRDSRHLALINSAQSVVQGNVTQSAGHAGWADSCDHWARLIGEKRVPVEQAQTQDTTYVDPATRPSQRRKGPALKVTP